MREPQCPSMSSQRRRRRTTPNVPRLVGAESQSTGRGAVTGMTPRPDSPLNVYARLAYAILADAERELDPAARAALLAILAERIRWMAADRPRAA